MIDMQEYFRHSQQLERKWQVDPELDRLACDAASSGKLVLDIGGRTGASWRMASHSIGWEGDIRVNLTDPLPFQDKEVDFAYCRHTIEDMSDPSPLLGEIHRVAKAGYIESPSPIVELNRGVDSGWRHRGFWHHRWVCLGSGNSWRMIAKYPVVETLRIPDFSWWIGQTGLPAWNTACLFSEDLPLIASVAENESGFSLGAIGEDGEPIEYLYVLCEMLLRFIEQTEG